MHTHLSGDRGRPALPGLHRGLRRQGADLPVPHLVARRLRRGPDGRRRSCWRPSWPSWAPTGSSASTSTCSPRPRRTLAPRLLTLAVIGILYGAIVACAQRDLKRLVAYSSLAQIGFIALGTFALNTQGLTGGVLLMVNHGLIIATLFILVGCIYERRGTWQVAELQGPAEGGARSWPACSPWPCWPPSGCPGSTASWASSWSSRHLPDPPLVGGGRHRSGVIVAAIYLLWAYQQVFHGEPTEEDDADDP